MNRRDTTKLLVLLLLGLAQMAGVVLGQPWLSGLAAATAAAPAPKVFCSAGGLETFSTAFTLRWRDQHDRPRELALTPKVYGQLQGPYNRRNVYGALLAYGPVLATNPRTEAMFRDGLRHGLCGEAPLLAELGLDPGQVHDLQIAYSPRPGTAPDLPLILRPECTP